MTSDKAGNLRPSPTNRYRTRALFAVKLAISLSLVTYLVSLVDFPSLREHFGDLSYHYIGYAVLLLLCQSLLSSFKWRTLLDADGVSLKYFYLLKTYLISNFVSLFLPTSFGGDVYRVMAVRKVAMNTAKTTSSVLFDRLTGLFALLSLACVGYLAYPGLPLKWLVTSGGFVGILIIVIFASKLKTGEDRSGEKGLIGKIFKIVKSFRTYAANHRCLATALIVSLVFQLNIVVINKMYSLAFGLDIPFMVLLSIIPLIYLTEAIPVSINGLGFREGAFIFFYQLIGQTAEAGFGVALLVLSLRYTMGLIGGGLLIISLAKDRSIQTGRKHEQMR